MRSLSPRPVCRASNSFSLPVALWQQFVAPAQFLLQHTPRRPNTAHASTRPRDEPASQTEDSGIAVRRVSLNLKGNRSDRSQASTQRNNRQRPQQRPSLRSQAGQDGSRLLAQAYESYNSAQDYLGVAVQPIRCVPVKESKYPWVPQNRNMIKSGQDRLNLEIQKFHNFIRPNQAESVARKHVVEQVRQHVQSILPDYALEVFGSERTGIAFAASDIDLRLVPQDVMSDAAVSRLPPSPKERIKRRTALRRLFQRLQPAHRKHYILPALRWARYPLISVQDRASGLTVQVVLSNDTTINREFIRRYIHDYPHLPQLYSVIKASLDVRGLSDVFRGGIGSYSLFMMIVASLKHNPHPRNDAAGSLEHFLHFWSDFKAEGRGVSIEPPEFFDKSEQRIMNEQALANLVEGKTTPLPQWMLTLRDPADETNDLGRKTVAWKHIQATFRDLFTTLRTEMKQNSRVSLIANLVGPIYTLQQSERKRLTSYGRSLAEAGRQHVPTKWDQSTEAKGGAHIRSINRQSPDLEELAAIAQVIRDGRTVDTGSIYESVIEGEMDKGEDEARPWLVGLTETSDHEDTGNAFSSLLNLDMKANTSKREE